MGLSIRIFIVDEDDSLHRLALARYERLLTDDHAESIPEYAGKRVRYALVVVALVNRRPVEIVHAEFSWLSFDSEGRLDRSEKEKEARLAMQAIPPLLGEEDSEFIAQVEDDILDMYPPINDMKIKMRLDKFFFTELPASPFGKIMEKMSVVGGARKVTAAQNIAEIHGIGLSDLAVIGDSITDFKMLKAVHEAGGLAVAFNGNQYAIPYATVGCATTNMMDMYDILRTWRAGGRDAVISAYYDRKDVTEPYIHVLEGKEDFSDVIAIHKKVRKEVRGKAAKLG